MLIKEKIQTVCKIGRQKDCCRYLACWNKGFECLKVHPSLKATLDKRVENDTISAQGDNCEGDEGT